MERCGQKPQKPQKSLCGAIQRTREVLELITDKWVINVIYALSEGTKRYSQLEREVAVVSQKMLTQTLRRLERDGLIDRRVYPVVPPRVEYSLTPLGQTLVEPLTSLRDWALAHRDQVDSARNRPGELDEASNPDAVPARS
jgi:DNA-binding HxlR family transcriptional regulator